MPETLVIRLPDDETSTAECVLVDPHGAPGPAERASLEEAARLGEGRKVIGLVPASLVLRTRANIPLKNKSKIQQALPFALEEQLAADVDAQHFAFAPRDMDGSIPVAVVAADLVEGWLERFASAGIRPDALFAESDALTAMPSTITVLVDGDTIVIRAADGTVTTADPDSLQALLELILETPQAPAAGDETATDEQADDSDLDKVPVNLLVYCNEADHERFAVFWDMLRLRVDSLDVRILADGALPRLASHIVSSGGVNLLQGRYAPKRQMPVQWRQWQLPGALVAGVVAAALLLSGIELWQLSSEEQALDAAAVQLLATTFPGSGDSDDPWSALRSRLGDTGSEEVVATGPGFAGALEALGTAYRATGDINLQALSYRDGKLDVQLIAPNVQRLEQLRLGIAEAGDFEAEIQSANPDGDTVRGRMKISPRGAG